ncbi:hypothetical protein BWR59_12915 [Pseudomonas sp. Bc-h]|nr:hypothetical protein BWR59_12915 [Pseudomonas sp. Bc-h]
MENTGLAGGDVNSTMVQICSAVDTRVGLWCLARLLIMPKAWERACKRSASVRRTAVSGFTAAARQIAAVVTSGVSHGFRGVHKSGGTDESVGFTAAARQIAAIVTSGVSHGFRGVRAVFLQLPAYGHYSYRFERGMRISRTTPNLWELLELCDSGEAVVQTLMYGLPTAFAAVVTSGVSHRFCSIPATPGVFHERGYADYPNDAEPVGASGAVRQWRSGGAGVDVWPAHCVRCRRDRRHLPQVSRRAQKWRQ